MSEAGDTVLDAMLTGPAALPPFRQLQRWNNQPLQNLAALNITILRNIVLDPIVPYLRYMAYQEGFDAKCRFGEYDNIVQEAVGGSPELLGAATDCVLIFAKLETLAPRIAYDFASLSASEVKDQVESVQRMITDVLAGIRRQASAIILWHSFELPIHPSLGTLDGQRRGGGQSGVIRELNDYLGDALHNARNAFLVDLNRCLARVGANAFYDPRYWHAARAPYTLNAVREIAWEDSKFLRALKGKARKCLVLDCDGVLWGGTIGEDGLAGIKLGTTYPGSGFREFQQEALNLHARGVLLALCSKNNPDDVWEVFDRHPEMVLRKEHFAATRINWEDKATNLQKLARELNIGIDSLVMVDDSEFELDLIRRFVPEVSTIRVSPEKSSEYRNTLASCGLFDTLTMSVEDRARGAAYQAEAGRKQLQHEAGDLESFLRSLEIVLEIRLADDFALPRVAQLTQKTNQFNLTTRRYSDEDIRRFSERGDADVIYFRYRDRFGDAGIVGVCLLVYENETVLIDSLLLSCRVLGRAVERIFLAQCLARARLRGARHAVGEFRPTAKNAQVKDFYAANGFSFVAGNGDGAQFRLDLTSAALAIPDLYTIDSDILHEGAFARSAAIRGEPTP